SGGSFIFEVMQFARPRFFPKMDFTGFSEAEQLTYCWQHWAEGEVLLIVDDVTAYKQQVKPYLPGNPRFKVLLTTREQIPNVTPLNLEVLHPDDALKLLESIIGDRIKAEPETAEELCKWLGYLPLGLELVGRYLADEEDLSLAKMLQRLQRKRLKHSSLQNEDNTAETAELGVAAAFELSWERLQKQPETQQLGCLLSLFYPDAILWDLVELVYQVWQGEDIDLEDIEDSRRKLVKLSLFQRTQEKTYRLHQLLREFFRDKLEEQKDVAAMKQAFVTTMVDIADEIPHNITTQQVKQVELAIKHIEEVANSLTELLSDEDLITPFTGVAWFYQGQTLYSEAEYWLKQSVEITKSHFGDEHPYVAGSLNNLAGLYKSQGRYSQAEPLYQQALEMRQRLIEGDHPDVASSLNNLAYLYNSQGRNSEAEPLYQQALVMLIKTLGEDHPNTQTAWQNLIIFLIKVIQENKTDQLSDNEFIQSLVSQLQQQENSSE
ncbi:MAG: tetratricopeptide repeat protein, partial [Limnoraphis sp.]